jgi:hypothetical protein
MTEVVVALIMMLNGNMIEHTFKEKMSDCLRSKRIAERQVRPERVQFSCKNYIGVNYGTINNNCI